MSAEVSPQSVTGQGPRDAPWAMGFSVFAGVLMLGAGGTRARSGVMLLGPDEPQPGAASSAPTVRESGTRR